MGRPRKRGDCVDGPRPCPWSRCRYYLDKSRTDDTCALDVADRGGHTLEEVGHAIGATREWARKIEVKAMRKLVDRAWRMVAVRELLQPEAGYEFGRRAAEPRWMQRLRDSACD